MPSPPSRAAIEGGSLVEGSRLDFKQKVDLESERGKTKIVDDVVAMLTAGPGYLVIGVAEEKGRSDTSSRSGATLTRSSAA